MPVLSDFSAKRLLGGNQPLSEFAGKVVLVVNVASKCGLTPQYEGLEALYEELGSQGFVVLGFPCNQFSEQEPGTESEIAEFCTSTYGVKFPMMGKIEVNGPDADPLYKWLKAETPGSDNAEIEWNFAKFLVGRDGKPIRRFATKTEPAALRSDIEALL
jgi:glutathione peroxidase